jgi:hypothetical protein
VEGPENGDFCFFRRCFLKDGAAVAGRKQLGDVIDLDERKRQLAARKAFRSWVLRFGEAFDFWTRLRDLSDRSLYELVQGGETSGAVIQGFVMAVLGMGERDLDFQRLEPAEKIDVIDITLFLVDQLRFECMRRLGWVETYPADGIPLMDMVEQFAIRFQVVKNETPPLAETHPAYADFQSTFQGDRASFVRRLIPEAIQAFGERVRRDPGK